MLTLNWFHVDFYYVRTVTIISSSPFDRRTLGSSLARMYGEGLGVGHNEVPRHIFLTKWKQKVAEDSHPIKDQHKVHDNGPFLTLPLSMVFQYLSLFNTCWIKPQSEVLGHCLIVWRDTCHCPAQVMSHWGYCVTWHTQVVASQLPCPSLLDPPSNLGIHSSIGRRETRLHPGNGDQLKANIRL